LIYPLELDIRKLQPIDCVHGGVCSPMTLSNAYPKLTLCVLALLGMPAYGQPTSQTDAASKLRTVLAALNSDVTSIRGPLQKDTGKSRTYQATVALIPESLDECTLNMYGRPGSSFWSNTYSCSWANESVEPLRRVYAELLSTLKAANGASPGLLRGRTTTNHWIAHTEVMLSRGHKGTKVISTIACPPGHYRM
jgi:hypothetical protein